MADMKFGIDSTSSARAADAPAGVHGEAVGSPGLPSPSEMSSISSCTLWDGVSWSTSLRDSGVANGAGPPRARLGSGVGVGGGLLKTLSLASGVGARTGGAGRANALDDDEAGPRAKGLSHAVGLLMVWRAREARGAAAMAPDVESFLFYLPPTTHLPPQP